MKQILAIVAVIACSSSHANPNAHKRAPQPVVTADAASSLVIGEYAFSRVVDGDTIHVDGLDASLRLLGLDTEETFKHESERRAYAAGWDAYVKTTRGTSPRPVKFATPMGMAAKDWAEKWFAGVDKVRLERDHPAEIRDRYNRYLAYVFANKNGTWLNYNVEAVRAGMAPYFPKYGTSRRFDAEFRAAEAEAKAAQRGIWAPGAEAYPDYPEREAWWAARADFVAAFRNDAAGNASYIDITHADALEQLEAQLGKQVVVLATVGEVYAGGPTRVMLSADFPLIFFDKDVLAASRIAEWKGEYVIATGVPSIYENKHTHKRQLQIIIERAAQIRLSPVPGLTVP
jgi:endonuclease YncB( thermonuclease family)